MECIAVVGRLKFEYSGFTHGVWKPVILPNLCAVTKFYPKNPVSLVAVHQINSGCIGMIKPQSTQSTQRKIRERGIIPMSTDLRSVLLLRYLMIHRFKFQI